MVGLLQQVPTCLGQVLVGLGLHTNQADRAGSGAYDKAGDACMCGLGQPAAVLMAMRSGLAWHGMATSFKPQLVFALDELFPIACCRLETVEQASFKNKKLFHKKVA